MVDNVSKVVTRVAEEALEEVKEQSFNHLEEPVFHIGECPMCLVSCLAGYRGKDEEVFHRGNLFIIN